MVIEIPEFPYGITAIFSIVMATYFLIFMYRCISESINSNTELKMHQKNNDVVKTAKCI